MCSFKDLYCKLCLLLRGAKFDSSDIKERCYIFLSHVTAVKTVKTRSTVTWTIKFEIASNSRNYTESCV